MREVSVGEIESMIATGTGERKRLLYIADIIKDGDKPSDEDMEYLAELLKTDTSGETIYLSDEQAIEGLVITTTPNVEGSKIEEYLGIVSGEAVMGANIFRDISARVTDVIGGRSGQYEGRFREAKKQALGEMAIQAKNKQANAIVGVHIDYEMVRESMMMVSVHGTAVKIAEKNKVKTSKK